MFGDKDTSINAIDTVVREAAPDYEGRGPWTKSQRQGAKSLTRAIATFYRMDGNSVDYHG